MDGREEGVCVGWGAQSLARLVRRRVSRPQPRGGVAEARNGSRGRPHHLGGSSIPFPFPSFHPKPGTPCEHLGPVTERAPRPGGGAYRRSAATPLPQCGALTTSTTLVLRSPLPEVFFLIEKIFDLLLPKFTFEYHDLSGR